MLAPLYVTYYNLLSHNTREIDSMINYELITNEIISKIKDANEKNGNPISEDSTNETIKNILDEFDLRDDYDDLVNNLGELNYTKVRDAEKGFY